MKDSVLVNEVLEPYAQALLALAQDSNATEPIGHDVSSILALLAESPDLQAFLSNPVIAAERKKSVLDQILGNQVHPFTKNFLMLLVDRRRIFFLEGICRQFQILLRDLNKTVLAEVTSAVELNDDQKNAIRDRVKAMTGAHAVDMDVNVDRDLIGGVIIQVGSQVIDASLRGQLRRISLRLSA